jgi:hypothetical protein
MENKTVRFLDALSKIDRVNKTHESYMDKHVEKLKYHRKYMTILSVVVITIIVGMFVLWLVLR